MPQERGRRQPVNGVHSNIGCSHTELIAEPSSPTAMPSAMSMV
jgi:hypothetical protein